MWAARSDAPESRPLPPETDHPELRELAFPMPHLNRKRRHPSAGAREQRAAAGIQDGDWSGCKLLVMLTMNSNFSLSVCGESAVSIKFQFIFSFLKRQVFMSRGCFFLCSQKPLHVTPPPRNYWNVQQRLSLRGKDSSMWSRIKAG